MEPRPRSRPAVPGRAVRSTKRRGRRSAGQDAILAVAGPRWALAIEDLAAPTEPADRPLLLDVGVGTGEATVAWARARPEALVVAVEVYRPGIAALLRALERDGPENVRVLEADAEQVLAQVAPASVAEIRILFPDPWPKRRHVGRRLVDRAVAGAIADALTPGGELSLATDWPDYAAHARSMLAAERRLAPIGDGTRPDRPVTPYEQRGLDAGRPIAELRYRRREP